MEIADFVWLIAIVFWLFSGLISRIGAALRKAQGGSEPPEVRQPQRARPPRPEIAREARDQASPQRVPPPPPTVPAPAAPNPTEELERAFRELVAQVGLGGSEHETTASEHRQHADEREVVASEHRPTSSEHRRSLMEQAQATSEVVPVASENRLTASEHRKGELQIIRPSHSSMPPVREARPSMRAARVRRLLASRGTLADAIILREILGPAPGLDSRRT